MDSFLQAVFRPVTVSTFLAMIGLGVAYSIIYVKNVKTVLYNGALFISLFFFAMFITRDFVDGVDGAAGWIGAWFLSLLFLLTADVTRQISRKLGFEYKSME